MSINITLGKTYTDVITGFRGVATGHCQYISGCNQVLLSPRTTPEGTRIEPQWFDQQRLKLNEEAAQVVLDNGTTPGCDLRAPIR